VTIQLTRQSIGLLTVGFRSCLTILANYYKPLIVALYFRRSILNKVVISLALATSLLGGCSDKPVTANIVQSVTDFDYTMNGNQAVSISFGESKDNFCSATIYRSSVRSGYSVTSKQKSTKNISMDCNWGGKYYVQSSKHPTSADLKITNLDSESGSAQIVVSMHLVNPSSDSYFTLKNVTLNLEKEQISNLVKKI